MTAQNKDRPVLRDPDIRELLFPYFEERISPVRFFEELVFGKCRADAVMITDRITGFEIKSDADRLDRLPKQMRYYAHYCDRVVLVCTHRHLVKAKEILPEYWGILVACYEEEQEGYRMNWERPPGKIPRLRLDTQMSLLWRSELRTIMQTEHIRGLSSRNKRQAVKLIIEKLGKDKAHACMCAALMERDYTIFDEKEDE